MTKTAEEVALGERYALELLNTWLGGSLDYARIGEKGPERLPPNPTILTEMAVNMFRARCGLGLLCMHLPVLEYVASTMALIAGTFELLGMRDEVRCAIVKSVQQAALMTMAEIENPTSLDELN